MLKFVDHFGNLLRIYKSAFRGKSIMKHTDRNYRRMWNKYVPVNLEQYWYTPLFNAIRMVPYKISMANAKR